MEQKRSYRTYPKEFKDVTVSAIQKTDKKASQLLKLFRARFLVISSTNSLQN
jgi:hypothetical protein